MNAIWKCEIVLMLNYFENVVSPFLSVLSLDRLCINLLDCFNEIWKKILASLGKISDSHVRKQSIVILMHINFAWKLQQHPKIYAGNLHIEVEMQAAE